MRNDGENGAPKVGGTPTFLAVDIDRSDYVYSREINLVSVVMARYRQYLSELVSEHGGVPIADLCIAGRHMSAFDRPSSAVMAAFKLNRAFAGDPDFKQIPVQARFAVASGELPKGTPLAQSTVLRRADALEKKARGEQIVVTLATQDMVRDLLPEEFGFLDVGTLQPAPGMRSERVFQLTHPDLPTDFPPIDGLEVPGHNIPHRLTFFLGREQEIEGVLEALDASRIVTLVGSGGVGKTSLACRVAIGMVEDFESGVRFVDLSSVSTSAHVVSSVAETLGVRSRPGMTLEQTLFAEMGPKQFLLLLDNCDLVAEELARFCKRFLRACTRATLLMTSRKPIKAEGERVYEVPSLAVPAETETDLHEIAEYDAVALFIDRVRAQKKSFMLTEANVKTVVSICKRLDGIPLALELAASNSLVMSLEEILARLEDRFGLLDSEQRLHEMVDWSYGQLSDAEKALFRRLAVFAGGWTLSAVQAVCVDKSLSARQARVSLDRLVEYSMVVRTVAGGLEGTFGFLETIRAFAKEKLTESGEEDAMRQRHCEWCLDLARQAAPHLEGADQALWLELLDRNRDNLRAAIDWSLRPGADPSEGYAFIPVCYPLWIRRSWHAEGRNVIERVLDQSPVENSTDRARALNVRGLLATRQGHFDVSRQSLYDALHIYERIGFEPGIASVYANLGVDSIAQGNEAAAVTEFEKAVTRWRELGDDARLFTALSGYAEALVSTGRLDDAQKVLDEAADLADKISDRFLAAAIAYSRGELAMARGDSDRAEAYFRDHVVLCEEISDLHALSNSLRMLAYICMRRGAYERAVVMLGADLRCRDLAGTALSPREAPALETATKALQAEIDPSEYADLFDSGYCLHPSQMVRLATMDGFLSK